MLSTVVIRVRTSTDGGKTPFAGLPHFTEQESKVVHTTDSMCLLTHRAITRNAGDYRLRGRHFVVVLFDPDRVATKAMVLVPTVHGGE
jgi:hypothetical protein